LKQVKPDYSFGMQTEHGKCSL